MILGLATRIVLNSDQVAMSTSRRRRIAKFFPVESKETCVGGEGIDNSVPDIGGGMLRIRRGVNLRISIVNYVRV